MNSKSEPTRIMVFGTFDVIHKGHLHFFRQARKLARHPYLIVSVARDSNVRRIKGRKPSRNQKQRLAAVKEILSTDLAVLGAAAHYLDHIVKARPRIIALGYDQEAYTENLSAKLAEKGLAVKVIRLKAYKPDIFKSSILLRR